MDQQIPALTFQQIIAGAGTVFYLMKYLKTKESYKTLVTKVPLDDRNVYRIVAGILSLITSLGVTYLWQPNPNGSGWVLSFMIPGLGDLIQNFSTVNWGTIFVAQQVVYDGTRRPAAMPHDKSAGS